MNAIFRDVPDVDVPESVAQQLRDLMQDANDSAALAASAVGELRNDRQQRSRDDAQLAQRARQHVERHVGAMQAAEPIKVVLQPRETPTAALVAARAEIERMKVALKDLRNAPPSAAEMKARARELVAKQAEAGRPLIESVGEAFA